MSSTVFIGREPILGPVPRQAEYGLLSVVLPGGVDRFRSGYALEPYPSGMPVGSDACAEGTFRLKDAPTARDLPDGFQAFRVYLGDVCTTRAVAERWDQFRGMVNDALRARRQWALERQLVAASFATAPHLGDANSSLPAGAGAVAARVAVSYLEDAIAAAGIAGVIHLTPSVASATAEAITTDGEMAVMKATGTKVVVGQGYTGADRPEASGAGAAAAGQSWIYASHDILYDEETELFELSENISESLDREDNTVVYRAEYDMVVGFDPALQAAVLADWSP